MDKRIFVEKSRFSCEIGPLVKELQHNLQLKTLNDLRIVQVYDVFDLAEDLFAAGGKISSLSSRPILFWMKLVKGLILRSMLSLRLKACLVTLTNVRHLHKKLCCCWVVQMM